MATNDEAKLASVQAATGTARGWNGDWIALFDAAGIAAGDFNGRMLAWINAQLGTSYTSLVTAQNALAVNQGAASWGQLGTFTAGATVQVATRTQLFNSYGTTNKQIQSKSGHIARSAVSSLQIGFIGYYLDGDGASGTKLDVSVSGTTTITAAIEYPASTYTQVKFSGSASGSLTGGALLLSDAVTVSIPAGAQFWVRTYATNATGLPVQWGGTGENAPVVDNANFADYAAAAASGLSDNTLGGAYGTQTANTLFAPNLIVANTTQKAFLLIGDSRCHGARDTADSSGDTGELARSIGPACGYTKYACGGLMVNHVALSNAAAITLMKPYFSHVISELSFNDANGSAFPAAKTFANIRLLANQFVGKWFAQSTTCPGASSTDSYATLVNQTAIANDSIRTAVNDLIRGGTATEFSTYFEIADVLESSRNSGKWKTGSYVYEAFHESQTGYLFIKTSNIIVPASIANSPTVASFPTGVTYGNATNLLNFTEKFDNAYWTSTNVNLTASAITPPDTAKSNGFKVAEKANTTYHDLSKTVAGLSNSTQYTFSGWVKYAGRKWLELIFYGGTADRKVYLNIQDGWVGTVSTNVQGFQLIPYASGWYRFGLTATMDGSGSKVVVFRTAQSDNQDANYAGDGTSGYYLWGVQVETGATMSAYNNANAIA